MEDIIRNYNNNISTNFNVRRRGSYIKVVWNRKEKKGKVFVKFADSWIFLDFQKHFYSLSKKLTVMIIVF